MQDNTSTLLSKADCVNEQSSACSQLSSDADQRSDEVTHSLVETIRSAQLSCGCAAEADRIHCLNEFVLMHVFSFLSLRERIMCERGL